MKRFRRIHKLNLSITLLRICVLLSLSLLLSASRSAYAQKTPLDGLDSHVAKAVHDWDAPGLSIAVVKDDSVVFAKGYGVRKLGESAPVDEHTLFAIGSSSKAFTTTAIGMLVDEGKIKWDDRVRHYVPQFQLSDGYVEHELTVRDLFCHRGALARADYIWSITQFDRDEILRRARYLPQVEKFRYVYGYNNIMFIAGGQIIPALTGKTWDAFVRERIFDPLGMKDTNTSTKDFRPGGNVASPHSWTEGKAEAIPWRNIDNAGPAGSVNSSAAEMARWLRLQLNDGTFDGKRLVNAATLAETHEPQMVMTRQILKDDLSIYKGFWPSETHFMLYGLGWFLEDYRGRKVIWHGGAIDGMNALVAFMPEEKLGVVALVNLNRDGYNQILPALMWRVFDAYLGVPERDWSSEFLRRVRSDEDKAGAKRKEAEKPTPNTKPSLPLSKYAGRYVNCVLGDARIVEDGGSLVWQGAPFAGPLQHWHYDTFQVTWTDVRAGSVPRKSFVNFQLNSQGHVSALTIEEQIEFRRAPDSAPADWKPDACR
jgi:CubicO group peptidase (beta-lactamase class C family)